MANGDVEMAGAYEGKTERMNMVEALNLALKQEMARDESVVVLGEDVGIDEGVFRVTAGLLERFPERVFDTPLAESAIVGTSLGLALYGFRPVCEIQFDGFIPPAYDQLYSHVSRMRNRSRGAYSAPLVVRVPVGGGIKALEHHSESLETIFVHMPGIKVVMPSTPKNAKGLLASSIRDDDPVIFMEPKRIYRAIKEEVPIDEYTIPLGVAETRKSGTDLTLITYGSLVRTALEAAERVQNREHRKYDVEVIDLRTLYPLDEEAIVESVKRTGRAIVVHEAPRTVGLGAEIAAMIMEKAFLSLEAPVARITGYDVTFPYLKLEDHYIPSVERIVQGIEDTMNF